MCMYRGRTIRCVVRNRYVPHVGTYGTSTSSASGLGRRHVQGWYADITSRGSDCGVGTETDSRAVGAGGWHRYPSHEAAIPGAHATQGTALRGRQASARETIEGLFEKDRSEGSKGFQPCSIEKSGRDRKPRSWSMRPRRSTACACAICRHFAQSSVYTAVIAAGPAFRTTPALPDSGAPAAASATDLRRFPHRAFAAFLAIFFRCFGDNA